MDRRFRWALVAALLLSVYEAGHHHFCTSFTTIRPASQCASFEVAGAEAAGVATVEPARPRAGRMAAEESPETVRILPATPSRGRAPPFPPSFRSASNPISDR